MNAKISSMKTLFLLILLAVFAMNGAQASTITIILTSEVTDVWDSTYVLASHADYPED